MNAFLGLIRTESLPPKLDAGLAEVQHELFDVGADLASPWQEKDSSLGSDTVSESTRRLEMEIDHLDAQLEALKEFILPAGTKAASLLHLARTVCRRAERRVVILLRQGRCNPEVEIYLNRLSDWLFVWARAENRAAGVSDVHRKKKTGEKRAS